MRIALALSVVLVMQATLSIAGTPKSELPTIQRQILEIDLRVTLDAYERVSKMYMETSIELDLWSGEIELDKSSGEADALHQDRVQRFKNLSNMKRKLIASAHETQHKINEIVSQMEPGALAEKNNTGAK